MCKSYLEYSDPITDSHHFVEVPDARSIEFSV